MISTRTLTSLDELDSATGEWLAFIDKPVVGSNLSNDPRKIRHVVEADDSIELSILVFEDDAGICCIAPLYYMPNRFRLSLSVIKLFQVRLRMLRIFGSYPVVRADCDYATFCERIFDRIDETGARFDVIYAHHVDCESPFWAFLQGEKPRSRGYRLALESTDIENAHLIEFDGDHDRYLASLGKKSRQNLQRTTRKLLREQAVELVKYTRPEQVGKFLDDFDRVYRNSWQAKTFGYLPKNSAGQLAYVTQLAAEGWLQSYILYSDGVPIAFEHTLKYGSHFAFQECGFDQDWAAKGVGSIAIHLAIKDIFDASDGPVSIDFGIGDAAYKRTFGNKETRIAALYLYRLSARSAALLLQSQLHRRESIARRLIARSGLDRLIRKLLKHQK